MAACGECTSQMISFLLQLMLFVIHPQYLISALDMNRDSFGGWMSEVKVSRINDREHASAMSGRRFNMTVLYLYKSHFYKFRWTMHLLSQF